MSVCVIPLSYIIRRIFVATALLYVFSSIIINPLLQFEYSIKL